MKINFNLNNKCGVYQIMNIVNGKSYIGSSKNLYNRLHEHFHNLKFNKSHNAHLQAAYNKYKKDNFIYNILEFCDESEQFVREQYYIDLLKPQYNFALQVQACVGRKLTEEIRTKISNTLKNKYQEGLEVQRHPSTWKKVYLYDAVNKIFIKEFECIQDLLNFINCKGHTREWQLLCKKFTYSFTKYTGIELIDQINEHIYYLHRGGYLGVFINNNLYYFRSLKSCYDQFKIGIDKLIYNREKASLKTPYIDKNLKFLFFFSDKYISLNAVPIKEFQELLQTKNGKLSKENPVVTVETKNTTALQSVGIEPD